MTFKKTLATLLIPAALLFGGSRAKATLYDDFSSGSLDASKWGIRQNTPGWPLTDEYFVDVIDENYHMAQLNTHNAATVLEVKDRIFGLGEIIEYDVDYIYGSGNRVHTVSLNGMPNAQALFGFWNAIPDKGVGNDLGNWHVKISFNERGALAEMTRPDGTIGIKNLNAPGSEYTFGIVTRTGHNGLVHMDYDNFYIIPEPAALALLSLGSLALLRKRKKA